MSVTLITGIDGFTGRYVSQALAAKGHDIVGIVRPCGPGEAGPSEMRIAADLNDLEAIRAIVRAVRPDHVVHLAAVANVAHDDVFEIYRTNIIGTRNLLQGCAESDQRLQSVLIASSANIYGNAHAGMIDENVRPSPANDYAISKVAVENLAGIYGSKVPIIVTRPFNYIGIGQSKEFLVSKIVDRIRSGYGHIELGNIDVARDFSDVRSVADSYVRLLVNQEAIGETFNICRGKTNTLREVLELASTLADVPFKIEVNPALVRANEVRTLCGNPAKVERLIGPIANPPLEDTLRWMIES